MDSALQEIPPADGSAVTAYPTPEAAKLALVSDLLNVAAAEVVGGYVAVQRACGRCRFYQTTKTKYCFAPASGGCHEFKLKEAIDE